MKTTGIAMWAYTKTPDTKFDACWRITVILSEAEAKKLKDAGLKVTRNDDTGVPEYKFKRNVDKKKAGAVVGTNPPPRVVDAAKQPFDGIIGNGSIVNVQFAPFSWEYKGKKGTGADLVAIQIVDLVPFAGGGSVGDEFEVLDGTDELEDLTSDNDDDNEF